MTHCIKCMLGVTHAWHDDGTPNMRDIQLIVDEYINQPDSAGDNHEET